MPPASLPRALRQGLHQVSVQLAVQDGPYLAMIKGNDRLRLPVSLSACPIPLLASVARKEEDQAVPGPRPGEQPVGRREDVVSCGHEIPMPALFVQHDDVRRIVRELRNKEMVHV